VPSLFALLVTKGVATYHELGTIYTMEDALDMGEMVMVGLENEARMQKQMEEDR